MSKISNNVTASPASLFSSSTEKEINFGAKAFDENGNSYRYVRAGSVALVPGTLVQAPAEIINHQNLVPAAAAIGSTQVTVTLGATAVTADQYAGGYVVVTVAPGQGYRYKISGHPAANASTAVTLTLEDPILVAWTTSTRVDLVANPYNRVIINPATATSSPVGVAIFAIPANSYGWVQDGGVANVLADGNITVGTNVIASNAIAGAVEAGADGADLQANVGIALTGIATGEYGAIKLNL
jgi:hypothetical protein